MYFCGEKFPFFCIFLAADPVLFCAALQTLFVFSPFIFCRWRLSCFALVLVVVIDVVNVVVVVVGGDVTAGAQLVDAGCNVIALSRKGAPANGGSWTKSVKWVEGNALVREPRQGQGRARILDVHLMR